MTGLNLESFLHLLRADVGVWTTLGVIALLLALMTWTSWGSRRVLRKCLVLSVASHMVLGFYGSTLPQVLLALNPKEKGELTRERIRQIRVTPWSEGPIRPGKLASGGRGKSMQDPWDRPRDGLALNEAKVAAPRPEAAPSELARPDVMPEPPPPIVPDVKPTIAVVAEPPAATESVALEPPQAQTAPSDPSEIAAPVLTAATAPEADPSSPLDRIPARPRAGQVAPPDQRPGAGIKRSGELTLAAPASAPSLAMPAVPSLDALALARPESTEPKTDSRRESAGTSGAGAAPGEVVGDPASSGVDTRLTRRSQAAPAPPELAGTDVRRLLRTQREALVPPSPVRSLAESVGPLTLSRATPNGLPRLPEIQGAIGGRPLQDVPEVYRSRLDPNRSSLAQRAGATAASEQAVERALAWLARHQDADGRWDAGVARHADGTPVKGDDDFTVHCPPGEPCAGECLYWEADTAVTGLALLAFLGSGYTHTDGKYADAVGRGLEFLRLTQKPDGDLRGESRSVGMYCHAMATLALCEAYALTGDVQLRTSVERAVGFLSRSRARDGLSWRYLPGAERGDTSILGWVVMALKSAKVSGIPISATIQSGTLSWLGKVASGPERGLASYQPGQPATPTMTAEAWVCRQFLGVGGPGPMSNEAASYLLENGPGKKGRDSYNLYYWYYGTLAMYQQGGDAWTRWNDRVRDQIVRRQQLEGHRAGSWDPDDSDYGARGGRIYCTAMATLTLEVYYRFLRLYEEPSTTPATPPPGRFTRTPSRDRS
ncbi:prenyltransferase/squalene oxidase repeat-containing protein [Singulisphaera acidiphila]|uniref:Squalene cyclase C-terminal domain-containing protein n=1 Tax=Singulisphaera acidiphila (strain ATCC BAA-1392 / DSM 18658 / VKM B-2454 / MOB10) TaxID=886293 RepID=L0DJQ9_SINAD|nr:prenyltransferase/squalene oxidase repeat-containing protein [Singulisphaera acidiphila]AGA28871.1 hypothetical protein Sinac_4694 [Singulisphaera acidiphila DSM 18658]